MSLCINPLCNLQNQEDDEYCQHCSTSLIIDGRYRLVSMIQNNLNTGTKVYEAESFHEPGAQMILKALQQNHAGSEETKRVQEFLTRAFDREIRLLIELNHPGIPRHIANFTLPLSGRANSSAYLRCLVMEKVEGMNLDAWLKQSGKLRDKKIALNWLKQLAEMLDLIHTHSEGYIHRDIKPANIICKPNGTLALVDFGIAREIPPIGNLATRYFSPGYTSPEQYEGHAEPRSDFYALGRTFMHILAGISPTALDDDLAVSWDQKTAFPDSPLTRLIQSLCEKEIAQRPENAKEIISRVTRLQQQAQIRKIKLKKAVAKPDVTIVLPPPPPPTWKIWLRKLRSQLKKWWWAILILFFALGLLIAWLFPISWGDGDGVVAVNFGKELIYADRPLENPYDNLRNDGLNAYQEAEGETDPNAKIRAYERAYEKFDQIREIALPIAASKDAEETNVANAETEEEKKKKAAAGKAVRDIQTLIFRNNALSMKRSLGMGRQPYRIVVTVPVSLSEGEQVLFGIALAQEKFLQGGDQRTLVIGIVNDLNNKDGEAKKVAEKIARLRPEILAVVGHYTSSGTCQALSTYSREGIPLISSTSSAMAIKRKPFRDSCTDLQSFIRGFIRGTGSTFLRTNSTTKEEAERLVEYLKLNSVSEPKVIAFYSKDEVYSEDLLNQFEKALENNNGRIIQKFALSDPDFSDYSSMQETLQNGQFDAIALFVDGKTGIEEKSTNAAYKVIEANQGRKTILGSAPLYHANTINRSNLKQQDLERLVLAVDWNRNCNAEQAFLDRTKWGGFNRRMAQSYEAVQALGNVFQDGVSDRANLIKKLKGSTISSEVTRGAFIQFHENGDRNGLKRPKLVQVKFRAQNTEPIFSPIDKEECENRK